MKQFQVPLGTQYQDERGYIQNILNQPFNSAAIITSHGGTERSNHMHLNNDHYLYILSGSLEYYERNLDEDGSQIKPVVFTEGEMFYTPPGKVHKVVFMQPTVLLSLGKEIKTHEAHEADLIRVIF